MMEAAAAAAAAFRPEERPTPGWHDAALLMDDGTVREHAFRNGPLSQLIRRVLPPPPDAEDDVVFASELCFYCSGRFNRRSSVFSIYWQKHSDLVYALTGITHCAKLVVECGQLGSSRLRWRDGDASGEERRGDDDSRDELYDVPGIYMIRVNDGGSTGPRHVIWPGTSVLWAPDVVITTVRRRISAARALVNTFRQYFFLLERRSHEELVLCPPEMEERLAPLLQSATRGDSDMFDGVVASAYHRLRMSNIPRSSARLLEHCVGLAGAKKLLLLDVPRLENYFLCQVCLYELDEDEMGEEMLGMLAGKPEDAAVSGASGGFLLHRKTMKLAACLCLLLNSLHLHQEALEALDPPPPRVEENDLVNVVLRRYYRSHGGVQARTLAAARALLADYAETFSPLGSFTRLGYDRLVSADAGVSRRHLVALLRA